VKCPDDIHQQLLKVLSIGIRNIRVCCDRRQYERCGYEANHIHNIPALIEDFTMDKLAYYVEVEAAEYLRQINQGSPSEVEGPIGVLRHRLAELRDNH
jgi:hypothetical protein